MGVSDGYGLQWGRGLLTADVGQPIDQPLMTRKLQWGRGLLTADVGFSAVPLRSAAALQWGRGLLTADVQCSSPDERHSQASMGPRFVNRGCLGVQLHT